MSVQVNSSYQVPLCHWRKTWRQAIRKHRLFVYFDWINFYWGKWLSAKNIWNTNHAFTTVLFNGFDVCPEKRTNTLKEDFLVWDKWTSSSLSLEILMASCHLSSSDLQGLTSVVYRWRTSEKMRGVWGEKGVFFPRPLSVSRSPRSLFARRHKPEPGTGNTKACFNVALFGLFSTGFPRFPGVNEK